MAENLFANSSSSERKYSGFQIFARAVRRISPDQIPHIFTPNFMRCWMNSLSSQDRYLNKAALSVVGAVQEVIDANPNIGFTLLSPLIGKHGRPDFDRITHTKIIERIMTKFDSESLDRYLSYLQDIVLRLGQAERCAEIAVLSELICSDTEEQSSGRAIWALDQMVSLCRNSAVIKSDSWVSSLLRFLLLHGFCKIRKVDPKHSERLVGLS